MSDDDYIDDHVAFATGLAKARDQLLHKLNAAVDFDRPGEAADYASALKDVCIAQREADE
jgi:hypothetical protein